MPVLRYLIPRPLECLFDEFVSLGTVRNVSETAGEELVDMRIEEIEEFLLFCPVSHMSVHTTLPCMKSS